MTFDSNDYLERVLPSLLKRSRVAPPSPDAVVQFVVTDVASGDLHYRLTAGRFEVLRGVAAQPNVTVALTSADLQALSEDRLDVGPALSSRRLRVHGDTDYLRWLSQCLAS